MLEELQEHVESIDMANGKVYSHILSGLSTPCHSTVLVSFATECC